MTEKLNQGTRAHNFFEMTPAQCREILVQTVAYSDKSTSLHEFDNDETPGLSLCGCEINIRQLFSGMTMAFPGH